MITNLYSDDSIERAKKEFEKSIPMSGTYDGNSNENSDKFEVDSLELDYLDRIVKLCRTSHSKLIISQQPNYIRNNKYNNWLKSYCKNTDVTLIDLVKDTLFLNHYDYFFDHAHLNEKGARLFSSHLAKEIKEIMARVEEDN